MLLGRKDNNGKSSAKSGSSYSESNLSAKIAIGGLDDSDCKSHDEEDDDSPYFVKITLDSKFLANLEEPRLTEGQEIKEYNGYETLMKNEVFQEIILRELDMMFGPSDKQSKK